MPAATPVTTPPVPIVATEVLLLLQVPPEVASINVAVLLAQNDVTPEIADVLLIVTTTVATQPDVPPGE